MLIYFYSISIYIIRILTDGFLLLSRLLLNIFVLLSLLTHSLIAYTSYDSSGASNNYSGKSTAVKFQANHFSYAGPMAVLQLANDWNGKFKGGKDAISFFETELSVRKNNVVLGYLRRVSHQFEIGNDLARGFYYYNNEIELDERMRINAAMDSKVYSGSGLRLGYRFESFFGPGFENYLSVTPSLTALRLDNIIWGDFEGSLFYSNTDDWGGTIDLDYGYTKDHIVRRPLSGEYLGWLYGLDLNVVWDSPWLEASYKGINVFSKIYWDGLPTTTAQFSTETAFLLYGYEYYDNVILNAPALHYLEASAPLSFADSALKVFLVPDLYAISQNMHLFSSAQITPIRSFYYHGFQYRTKPGAWGSESPIKLGLQHDFSTRTTKLSMQHEYVSMEFASQTMDVSKSQQVVLKLGLHVSF